MNPMKINTTTTCHRPPLPPPPSSSIEDYHHNHLPLKKTTKSTFIQINTITIFFPFSFKNSSTQINSSRNFSTIVMKPKNLKNNSIVSPPPSPHHHHCHKSNVIQNQTQFMQNFSCNLNQNQQKTITPKTITFSNKSQQLKTAVNDRHSVAL